MLTKQFFAAARYTHLGGGQPSRRPHPRAPVPPSPIVACAQPFADRTGAIQRAACAAVATGLACAQLLALAPPATAVVGNRPYKFPTADEVLKREAEVAAELKLRHGPRVERRHLPAALRSRVVFIMNNFAIGR